MDRIAWDQAGSKFYESGVDRGVLYPLEDNSGGVPWNGLMTVSVDNSDAEIATYYFDGVPYLDKRSPSDFSASMRALTYPDEFLEFDGFDEVETGLFFGSQMVDKTFGLCWRTRVSNDVDEALGYKLHLAYNLTAKPDARTYTSLGLGSAMSDFGWTLSGIPQTYPGKRPTAYVILDSRKLDPDLLAGIEDILYGSKGGAFDNTIDGGNPVVSGPDLLDGGTPYASGPDTIDGGNAYTSGTQLGAPGPRLPTLNELATIISTWVPAAA